MQPIAPLSPATPAARPAGGASPREAAPAPPTPPAPLEPSPGLRLDPALNLVVLEFRDAKGKVVSTIPNAHQLAAYRAGKKVPD